MDCLADGRALHWGECKHHENQGCGCEDDDIPVCGKDFKTYKNQCHAKCGRVQERHQGSCGSIGYLDVKSPLNMM